MAAVLSAVGARWPAPLCREVKYSGASKSDPRRCNVRGVYYLNRFSLFICVFGDGLPFRGAREGRKGGVFSPNFDRI